MAAKTGKKLKSNKSIQLHLSNIIDADAANPLTMNIFISFFTIAFLAFVLVSLSLTNPEEKTEDFYRLIIDTYVPSIFTLCVSIILQTFVEATRSSNTHFMLNVLAFAGSFLYLFVYVLLPQSPGLVCLVCVMVFSLALLLLCLFALKKILIFENTDVNHIAANERSGL